MNILKKINEVLEEESKEGDARQLSKREEINNLLMNLIKTKNPKKRTDLKKMISKREDEYGKKYGLRITYHWEK